MSVGDDVDPVVKAGQEGLEPGERGVARSEGEVLGQAAEQLGGQVVLGDELRAAGGGVAIPHTGVGGAGGVGGLGERRPQVR